jgi:hypothetical protein
MKLWKLTQNLETKADFTNAQVAQGVASLGEAALLKSGVSFLARPLLSSITS